MPKDANFDVAAPRAHLASLKTDVERVAYEKQIGHGNACAIMAEELTEGLNAGALKSTEKPSGSSPKSGRK